VLGVQLVLFVCVAVANVGVDMVAGVVRFVRRDSVHVAALFGVPLVPFVVMALADVEVDMVAGVVRFVPRDGVQVAACVCRAAGAGCRRGGGGGGDGRGGGGGGAVCPEAWLARSYVFCVLGVVAALRVETSRRTRHVTTTSG